MKFGGLRTRRRAASNVEISQAKDLGGRRSRPSCGLGSGRPLPPASAALTTGGIGTGMDVRTSPWHPVHGPLEQQPKPSQLTPSDGADGFAGSAAGSVRTSFETRAAACWAAAAGWVAGVGCAAACGCAWPWWAEAVEGASESAARMAAAPRIRVNRSIGGINLS
jgi:hypothetical protein